MSSLPPTTAVVTGSRKSSKSVAKGPPKITKKTRGIPIKPPPLRPPRPPPPPRPSAAASVVFDTPGSLGLLAHILSFVGEHQYRFMAATSRRFKEAYLINFPNPTTKLDASTLARTKICWEECDHDFKEYWERFPRRKDTEVLFDSAKTYRDVPSLQYLFYQHESFGHKLCSNAATRGDLTELRWWHSIGCPWNQDTCSGAAEHGDLKMLQWCRANGCPWDAESINLAAVNGHLRVVKWCYDNDCPWDEYSCSRAAAGGHLKVLKWLRKKGCLWNEETLSIAMSGGHTDIVEWCYKNGLRDPSFDEFVSYAHLNWDEVDMGL